MRLWILTSATVTRGWPVMLIIAQHCQLLLCGQVQYNFNELIQTFILHKIKCYSLPNVTHDCFALPVITHYCLQLPMLWGPIPLNQIKREQIELNWIKLNPNKCWKWKCQVWMFVQCYPDLLCAFIVVLCYSPQPCLSIVLVIWESIRCNLIKMIYRWN